MNEYKQIGENDVIYRSIGEDLNKGILSCGFMRKRTSDRSQMHFCTGYYSCFLVLQGQGLYTDISGRTWNMGPGDLVQRFPDQTHSTEIVPDGSWLEFYISVGYPVFHYLSTLGLIRTDPPVMPTGLKAELLPDFLQLVHAVQKASDTLLPKQLMRAQELIIQLHQRTQSLQISEQEDLIQKACQMIQTAGSIQYDLKETAQALNIGYESFRKIFKQETGSPPSRYLTNQVMKQAQMMLTSGIPIKQTALSLGYSDTYAFTKQFTKSVGISPGQYRARGKIK